MHFADAMGNIYFSTAMPSAVTCAVVLLNRDLTRRKSILKRYSIQKEIAPKQPPLTPEPVGFCQKSMALIRVEIRRPEIVLSIRTLKNYLLQMKDDRRTASH